MEPEIWVAVAAVFVSGGAIGTAGTLLAQWLVRGLRPGALEATEELRAARNTARIQGDLRALAKKIRNLDERLDFQEQLLGGATPIRPAPPPLPPEEEESALAAGQPEGDDARTSSDEPTREDAPRD